MFTHRQVTVGASSIHVVEAVPTAEPAGRASGGEDSAGPVVLFLHGWPQSWRTWRAVMTAAAADGCRAIAIDLPGVGGSTGEATDGSKKALAAVVHDLIGELGLVRPTLVGQDVGGMIAWAYLRTYNDVERVVIMDTVIPGLDPWDAVVANPYIWHFAFHAIPELPETLVLGKQRPYFDYFFDVLSPDPARISDDARDVSAGAYATESQLAAGFNWYRTLPADARANAADRTPATTPLRYIRGSKESGNIEHYLAGFRGAGVANITSALIEGAGHFTQEEDPAATWRAIAA
jgi:pimeloyl-ACP methyl ester carboxylesterase